MVKLSEQNLYMRVMDAIRGKGTKFDHVTVDRLRPGDIVHITGPEPMLCRVVSLPQFVSFSPCFAIDKLPLSDASKDQDLWMALNETAWTNIQRLRWECYDWNRVEQVWVAALLAGITGYRLVETRDGSYVEMRRDDASYAIDINGNGRITFNGRVVEPPVVQNLLTAFITDWKGVRRATRG